MHASIALRRAAAASPTYTLASGAKIPKLGFGTWKLNKQETSTAVSAALSAGVRHIDSAWAYKNEDATGDAIQKSGIDRKDIFITSKLWNSFHGDHVETGLDATLRDLGTDYLDLYLMHWPVAFRNPKGSELASLKSQDGRPIENHILSGDLIQTWKSLEAMVKKGKVRNIGISNFNIRRVEELLKNAEINPVANQVEVNWGVPNNELLHYCEAHQVKLQAYSPLGSSDYADEYAQDPVLVDVAQRNNITPAQAMLAWHFARGINPITRSRRPERIQEALAATQIELPWEDVQHLTREAENKPIQRVVDPTEAWNVKEDIFEDGVDQTRLMSLKGGSLEVPLPHETSSAPAAASSASSHYLEPRNEAGADLKPTENVARFHTAIGARRNATRGSTAIQQLMQRRGLASSSSRPASSSSSFLASTSKQAMETSGLQWTSGANSSAARETRKMNMCSVRAGLEPRRRRFASSVKTTSAAGSSDVAAAATGNLPPVSLPSSASPTSAMASAAKRSYPPRKAFLFSQYSRLLESSQFVLFLQPNALTVADFSQLRAALASVPLPEGVSPSQRARLTVARAGVLRAAVTSSSASKELSALNPLLSGPLAILTCSTLSPSYLSKLLAVLDKALGNTAKAPAVGARQATVNPRLVPLAAIIEGKQVMDVPALRQVGKLPDLQTLRAQIVGLLSAPASQLSSVLNMAAGGHLALTLEARKRQLDEKNGDEGQSSA
ncbi:unnamed protein product [Jaminaea pallidilutea]